MIIKLVMWTLEHEIDVNSEGRAELQYQWGSGMIIRNYFEHIQCIFQLEYEYPKSPLRYTRGQVVGSRAKTNPTLGGGWASGILPCTYFIGFSYLKLGRVGASKPWQLQHFGAHCWHPIKACWLKQLSGDNSNLPSRNTTISKLWFWTCTPKNIETTSEL